MFKPTPGICAMVLIGLLVMASSAVATNHPVNQWVKQSPREGLPAPMLGWEGSGSYDPVNRKWIHHGGHDGNPQGFHTFTFDLKTGVWEQKFPNTSPPGICCVDGAHVFDIANQRFVSFPGFMMDHGSQWSRGINLKHSAVWLYDLSANCWTNMRPPPYPPASPRGGLGVGNAGATYDPNHELAISFGGKGGSNHLFVYDAYSNSLTQMNAENPPPPRDGMGLCYDSKNDCLVMFGSQYIEDERTWIYRYSTGKWEAHDLTPRPSGKKQNEHSTIPRMAFDSVNGLSLCITWDDKGQSGGYHGEHETWTFDAAKLQWTRMNPSVEVEPGAVRSRNLSYIAEENLFIMESIPAEQKGYGPQIWTYRIKNAPADNRPAVPTDLTVTTDTEKATLTWKATSKIKEFHVLRGEGNEAWNVKYEQVATVKEPRFEDKGLAPGKTYFYRVKSVAADGTQSQQSSLARTQPRVLIKPVVSVLADNKVEVNWAAHPAPDVKGYNIYRGLVNVRSVQKGTPGSGRDNDPEYLHPMPVEVSGITGIRKLNDQPLTSPQWTDEVDLKKTDPAENEYRFHVYAYIVKAVNNLGTESGPSPYVLTIPSEPENVLCREAEGRTAELKWDANPEKGISGYRIYRLEATEGHRYPWSIVPITDDPIQATTFSDRPEDRPRNWVGGRTRYWVAAVDALGQEGQPSSPVWYNQSYQGFFQGEWHQ